MKIVKGKTDHVVIVGAGLAGLSAALHLAGAGRRVTILERENFPGGRNGLLQTNGYSFDTGPTVLTMPSLIEEAFQSLGENMSDWLTLKPVSPLYRAFYHDESTLDVHANTAAMTEVIRRTIGASEAHGYEKYVDFVSKLYKYEMKDFIDRNIDSPLNLLTPNLAKLIARLLSLQLLLNRCFELHTPMRHRHCLFWHGIDRLSLLLKLYELRHALG